MEYNYDVVVVGAGNGGLVAATKCAKEGFKTLLLEKHNLPGGSASSFRRGRFEFEPSLHELCSVGTKENPQAVYNIFDEFGAKIAWQYEYATFRHVSYGKDGFDVKLRAGEEAFCDDMEAAVPGCRASVKAMFDLCRKDDIALDYVAKKRGNPNKLVMVLKHGDFMRMASHSVEQVEIALGMPKKARDILNTYWGYLGIPTDELNAMHYMSMVSSYVLDGAAMPRDRSHELSLALEKSLRDYGGEVWYNSEVTEFLYGEDGACVGVKIASGEKINAKRVISNIIPNNVYGMSEKKFVPERELKLANARKLGLTFVTVYIGLDATAEELGIEDYTVFITSCTDSREQYDKRDKGAYYVVNCLNKAIPGASPDGTSMLFFTIPMYGNELPDDLTPENYKKFKNAVAEYFIADYEKVMNVNVRDHIEEIAIATPVTFARYLGTPDGEIYGYDNAGWDNVINRVSEFANDFTVKGLTYCGGHSTRGDGYSSAYITGYSAADRVVSILKQGGND